MEKTTIRTGVIGKKFVYGGGSVLESCLGEVPSTVLKIFSNDIQGRLLEEAGKSLISQDQIYVVLVTDCIEYTTTGGDSFFGSEGPTVTILPSEHSEEIILGFVVRKLSADSDPRFPSYDTTNYETVRFEVPEQYGNKGKGRLALPDFTK